MAKPKKFIFVLMPFDESFSDLYNYGIKQTCEELNAYCERVDEQIFSERILDRIYNQISKADIIVADMTHRNANVFYEVGYAHGLGRTVILLTSNADDIPFDLKHFPHIIYNGQIKSLSGQLKKKLEWFLNEDAEEKESIDFGLEFLINGNKIEEGKTLQIDSTQKNSWEPAYNIKIDIFNRSSKTYKPRFKLGLEIEVQNEKFFSGLELIKPSPDKTLLVSKEIINIYPGAYKSVEFMIEENKSIETEQWAIGLTLKVFTPVELREINFSLSIPVPVDPFW